MNRLKMHYFVLLMFIITIICNCNSSSSSDAFGDDPVIEPKVKFMYPSKDPQNTTDDFPVSGKILVVLNKPINYDTAEACVTLYDEEDITNDIPEIELDPACINLNNDDDNMAVFQFTDKLQEGNNYKLIINGLKDYEGKLVPKTECEFKTSGIDTIIHPAPEQPPLSQSSSLIQLRMIDDVLLNPFTIQDDGFLIIKDGDMSNPITCSVNYDVENMILNIIPNEKIIITEKNENYSLEISKETKGELTLESLVGVGLEGKVSIPLDFLHKITASDGESRDYFGQSVAVSGNGTTIVVGSKKDDVGDNEDQGSIYIYTCDGVNWKEEYITASDGDESDRFGMSVAISEDGTTIVVGSDTDDVGSNSAQGSAYVYIFDGCTWNETKLTASDGESYDYFGISVAVSGDGTTIVVGSNTDTVGLNSYQGSAYVYTFDGCTWNETKLTASDGESCDYLGQSVAISEDGTTIVVGSYSDTVGSNSYQGSAYVYTFDGCTWNETKIIASDGESCDYFGISVAISGDGTTIVVGNDPDTGSNSAAYVYTLDGGTWNETKITASDGDSNDSFGRSVAVSGDGTTIVVGSYTDTVGSNLKQGSAYVYTLDGGTWNETKFTAGDGDIYDYFGRSVAISGDANTIVFGSYTDTVGSNPSQGSIYVFK